MGNRPKKYIAIAYMVSAVAFLLLLGLLSCKGGETSMNKVTLHSLKDVSTSDWKKLSEKGIYFGHQSVGFNILDGMKDMMKENPQIVLKIVETRQATDLIPGVLGHTTVGVNIDPKSKCDDFREVMNILGKYADTAGFKFCYVDFGDSSDVNKVFDYYQQTMNDLKKKYPGITFIHITAPLTTVQTGIKARIKEIMGKPVWGYNDNIKRDQFNQKLKDAYEGKEPIFDLAGIESTYPDGTRAFMKGAKGICPFLVPEYTTDGGHLNAKGRKVVAEQFLIFLAKLNS
jgi:hypothetical protein